MNLVSLIWTEKKRIRFKVTLNNGRYLMNSRCIHLFVAQSMDVELEFDGRTVWFFDRNIHFWPDDLKKNIQNDFITGGIFYIINSYSTFGIFKKKNESFAMGFCNCCNLFEFWSFQTFAHNRKIPKAWQISV